VGADGLIKLAGVNEPRFDHDPYTGESLGLLVEEARTNIRTYSILFGYGVSGALYGNWYYATIPSNTAAIAPDGTLTANRFRPTSATETLMQRFSATAGLTYTISMYLKLDPESPSNNNLGFFGFQVAWSNDGTNLTGYYTMSLQNEISSQLTNEWKRFSFSYTLPSGATSMEMGPSNCGRGVPGEDPNYSVLAWGWQIEQGAFPTSYIPTEGSSRTRAADNASITGKNFSSWYNSAQGIGTIFALAQGNRTPVVSGVYALVGTGFGFNFVSVEYDIRSGQFRIYKNSFGIIDTGTISNGVFAKTCISYSPSSNAVAKDGSILATNSTSKDFSVALSELRIGAGYGAEGRLNGTIARLTYYPVRLPDATLQVLTR
jgi:hypothetical protein